MKTNKTAMRYGINTIALVIIMFLTFVIGGVDNNTLKLKIVPSVWQCCYLIIMAASLNLVLGFLGQLSLGHCGFMAVGAYTAALVSLAFQRAGVYEEKKGAVFLLILLVSILASGLLAAALGVLVGIPALRLKGDYLAIITLGFGMIIVNLINNIPFCGQQGLSQGTASSALYANGLGFSNDEKKSYMYIAVLVVILCMTLMFMFVRSKFGRIICAIRDNEIAASASGIDVSFYKVLTFVFSAFFAGIAGALYSCCNAALATTSFAFTNGSILNSVFIVVMVVVGGMGSLTGSVVAAIGMFLLNYVIKNGSWVEARPGFLRNVFTYPMLVYSIALIVVIMFRPHGILGTGEFALCDIPKWPKRIAAHFTKAKKGLKMLKINNLHVSYGAIKALNGISLEVNDGELVSLIGANGAGKTTTLHAIYGLLKASQGEVLLDGVNLQKMPNHKIINLGMSQVLEGRHVFAQMTVLENLYMGAFTKMKLTKALSGYMHISQG